MRRFRKMYMFAVLGASGGLIAAALHQWLLFDALSKSTGPGERRLYNAVLGLIVGASIGFFPRLAEGLSHYSLRRAARDGFIGACLGGIGGAVAVLAGEFLHGQLGGGFIGRATAFSLLGLMVGLAEGIAGGALWWRGVLGGMVGGVVAGSLVEALLKQPKAYADSAIIALALLGLSISFFVSLFANVLLDAWLEGLPGSKVSGQIYQLSKFREPNEAILGSDKAGPVFIWIPGAKSSHAAIKLTRDGAVLRHIARDGETRVNGHPVSERLLRDREEIEIGSARLVYRERRGAAPALAPVPMSTKKAGSPTSRIRVTTSAR